MPTTSIRLTFGLALLTILGSLAACSGGPALTDRQFLSVAVTDGGVDHPLVAGTRIRLGFQAIQLSASAGCNTIGGSYHLDGGRLIFEGGSMTEMGCDPARAAQDTWLVALLGSKPTLSLSGDELTLGSGSIVVRLLDRKVVEPDRALAGPTWTVESIISGEVVSSVPSDAAAATLVFNADGTLTIFTGCNQGSASWSMANGAIAISDLVLTKKACPGSGAQLESALVAVLRAGTMTASIDSNALTLQAGASGLQLRAP